MHAAASGNGPASLRRLSQDYTVLRRAAEGGAVWDVVIVGSGYGGAMAAAELAGLHGENGQPLSVCVLERGREYAPGMFASSLGELPAHVRAHRGTHDGAIGRPEALLDLRIGEDVTALVANGLGGGSLINAGVMETPAPADRRWPEALRRDLDDADFDAVRQALGGTGNLQAAGLRKTQALERLAQGSGLPFRYAAVTVQTDPLDTSMPICTLCGDCMTGCNVGAKKSLDTTLLARAWAQGAQVYTGCSVLRVERACDTDSWLVETVYTDGSLRKRHAPMPLRARKVILAAGTLGSTEILLRSRSPQLRLSTRLGERFSCNGDNLVALHAGPRAVHCSDEEFRPFGERRVGPTITGIVELDGALVEEFAVPASLKRLFDEMVTSAHLLQGLTTWPVRPWAKRGRDSMAVDPDAMENTLLVGLIGHDESAGRIVLNPVTSGADDQHAEGRVHVEWPDVRASPLMDHAWRQADAAFRRGGEGASVLPNPVWRPVPASLDPLLQGKGGPVLTVHPLGGCAMAESADEGVVNHLGEVFDPQGGGVHEGLVVLDGSILPGSLGVNPALTIATIARRSARRLAAQWGWQRPATVSLRAVPPRPMFRAPADCTPRRPVRTEAEIVERLAGPAGPWWVEMTVCYEPVAIADLTASSTRELRVDPARSFLRVYAGGPAAHCELMTLRESERDQRALHIAPLAGRMTLIEPGAGITAISHAVRAGTAWLVNRGTRELWDRLIGTSKASALSAANFAASAARAGEMRVFDYALEVGAPVKHAHAFLARRLPSGLRLAGSKRLTYGRRSNPWRQLTELQLEGFPDSPGTATLKLDGRFLARQGVPLLRITKQENHVVALAEFASLAMCWARTMVSVHAWSFRAPDTAHPRDSHLRPLPMEGVPPPQQHLIVVEVRPPAAPVQVLLTHYPNPGRRPIALVHGYSASGTTFTHHAIPQPLARYLWQRGHDVWVLDLRTSAGMATATLPWRFEDAAFVDLPAAISFIRERTGQTVDVFAHCIGAVMLSMALLGDAEMVSRWYGADLADGWNRWPRWDAERNALAANLGRIVLSQKGPVLVYSDGNVLRAYFMRLLRRVALPDNYQFHIPADQNAVAALMDRLLSTLPYPEMEFLRENPLLPPWRRAQWAGFRHRMDALYARDFSLEHITPTTLGAIADLFGPLNLDTVAQAIHFARLNTITDRAGAPFDTSGARLRARWPRGGTLAIHGAENGLVDVHTVHLLRQQMDFAGVPFRECVIPGYGHQDCLIGRHAARDVFPHVSAFLQ
ncbi:GMC family oxidoreductase N-terminal domain-containing protein [Ramlibacter sp.]|uniref:GMC family oxidoreductase N-terminal domain-containing protein n=1 Tax=Ramlibacter sp. TaxID=1917967 RepID=UPI00260B4D4A|nr:GMC family oxidoreductase N-terminal domain-containing protein [Ramlibacter sp.]MDB5955644.1 hypothetical protein [Ramlibacter sp.]